MPDLSGKVVLIGGGAGEVGEGLSRAFLAAGATVVVTSRSQDKLDGLRARLGETEDTARLVVMQENIGELSGAERIRGTLFNTYDGLDHAVASLGGWWQGQTLAEVPLDTWERVLHDNLTSHFIFAKTFLPLVAKRGGTYTLINGGGALRPMPTAGPVVIAASAQLMLKDVLVAEYAEQAVRVNTLLLGTPVITRSRPHERPDWISADDAGRYAVYLASDAATENGETIILNNQEQLDALPD